MIFVVIRRIPRGQFFPSSSTYSTLPNHLRSWPGLRLGLALGPQARVGDDADDLNGLRLVRALLLDAQYLDKDLTH